MAKTLNTRTVPVNGEAIKRLRLKRGWTLADLAKHVKCSLRTATNLERGSNAYVYTITKFATVLKVDPSELMAGEKPPERKPEERVWEIRIRLATAYQDFDETVDLPKLMELLRKLLEGPDMDPKSVGPGSTEVVVEMTLHQIIRLIQAYMDGKLDSFNIFDIEAPTDFTAEDETRYTFLTGRAIYGRNYKMGTRASWTEAFPKLLESAMTYQEMVSGQRFESEQDIE